jgi:hypothetical protein
MLLVRTTIFDNRRPTKGFATSTPPLHRRAHEVSKPFNDRGVEAPGGTGRQLQIALPRPEP